MESKFLQIIITSPFQIEDEIQKVSVLLESGVCDILHLRKPEWTLGETADFLRRMPADLIGKIRLHDHFDLCGEFPLNGVQLNSRNTTPPAGVKAYSKSCHTLNEVVAAKGTDYVTLSPIFNSISKTGYQKQEFDKERLLTLLSMRKIIALGGVEPSHYSQLQTLGFSGAALLGYVWNNPYGKSFDTIVNILHDSLSKF